MSGKAKVYSAVFKRTSQKVTCKLSIVDDKLFLIAYYLLAGRIYLLGITKQHSSIVISPRNTVITMSENDWRLLNKAKPLVLKIVNQFYETKGLDFFKDTKLNINLI